MAKRKVCNMYSYCEPTDEILKEPLGPSRAEATLKRTRTAETPTVLPTGDDWKFRLKVLSSSADLDEGVLRDAVQGLIKICFPDGVLDELGVDIVEAHMQEQRATQDNIDRMRSMFHDSMIDHVAQMLARYLNTPERRNIAINAVVHAAQRLHGEHTSQETKAGDEDNTREDGPLTVPAKKKTKDKHIRSITGTDLEQQGGIVDKIADDLKNSVKNDNRVSRSWRWNIDAREIDPLAISDIFKRTADLFAYHALPIVRPEIGSPALKKPIRAKIQSLIDSLSSDQYQGWIMALKKLKSGDMTMLERVSSMEPSAAGDIARATPAPSTVQQSPERRSSVFDGAFPIGAETIRIELVPRASAPIDIKRETAADSGETARETHSGPREQSYAGYLNHNASKIHSHPVKELTEKGLIC
ncbi:hypothetical protein N0V90_003067 [Kalmusia sp. IMI 367209]|nr:hypothetical protein N0V90_003067 [Kalmusia sp. IMI 367209]